jgi:hypothetical protein
LLIAFAFVLSAASVSPVGASLGPVSYNPAPFTEEHAPVSTPGLMHAPFGNSSGKAVAYTPTVTSGLVNLTPTGSIRFINDSSYVLQSETSIAVDPTNPNHIVGTYNDGRYFFCPVLPAGACPSGWTASLSGFTTSSDGGHTVAKSSFIPSIQVKELDPAKNSTIQSLIVSWGDPDVVAAPNGLFYYSSLAIDPITGANGIEIAVSNSSLWGSSSCTTTESTPQANPCWTAAFIYGNTTVGANTLDDKDLGAVDWSPSSLYFGDIYVTWDHFFGSGESSTYGARCDISLHCTMISGGGAATISGSDPYVAFSMPQVGPDGTVYVSWCNYGTSTTIGPVTCRVASSPAGGTSFGAPNTVLSFMGPGTTFPSYSVTNGFATEQFRTASIPVIASDATNANNLYFVISVCSSGAYYVLPSSATDNPGNCGDSSVIFAKSTDKGVTWGTPQILSSPAVNNQPWVTVDRVTGEVVVAWQTSQFDPFNHRIDILSKVSNDGGTTWSARRITSVSDEPDSDPAMYNYLIANGFGGSFVVPQYGDYFQVQALQGKLYVLYTAHYTPEQGTYKASPFLAVTPYTTAHLALGGGSPLGRAVTQGSPLDTVPFNATGFTPNASFQLWLSWGGITEPLANGTVSVQGGVTGTFVVPDIQSQVYTITANDSSGVAVTTTFGIKQVNLVPVLSSVSQLSTTLQGDFNSLSGAITGLSTSLSSGINSIQGSLSADNSSLSKSMSNGFSLLQGSVTSLSSGFGITGNGINNLSSNLTTTEYLVVIAILVAAITLVVVLVRKPKSQ